MDQFKEPQKPYRIILEQELKQAVEELNRPMKGLFTSGLLAGIGIGISPFLIAVLLTRTDGTLATPLVDLLVANFYTVGFIVVILGRTDLFTEYTTIAILPILDGRASIRSLGRLWGLVYLGNLLGALLFAGFATVTGPALDIVDPEIFGQIAEDLVAHDWWVIVLSGILAGWLMGLLSWLIAAGRDTIGQIFFVWIVALAIGFCHLHHSIAGAVEVFAGVFAADLGLGRAVYVLLWSTTGNAIGGIIFAVLVILSLVMSGEGNQSPDRRYRHRRKYSDRQRQRRSQ